MSLNNPRVSITLIIKLQCLNKNLVIDFNSKVRDRLCGLVVRVPGYRPRGPGSIPRATRFSEK
jgi:hypothetical protein